MFRNQHEGHLERGAAAVEMALVLPLLLLVLFGLIDFGRAFNAQMQLTQAAREGVRMVVVERFANQTDAFDDAETRARLAMPGGGTAWPEVQRDAALSNWCGDGADLGKITLHSPFTFITPLGPIASVASRSGSTLGADLTLSAQGVMRCQG